VSKTYHVEARWDADAGVWVSTSDIPGLVIEAADLTEFEALIRELAPQLLVANGEVAEGESVPVQWKASGEIDLAVA
jgi:predicted RNase H-like HicB family nuclease